MTMSEEMELREAAKEFLRVFDKDALLQCDPELDAIAIRFAKALSRYPDKEHDNGK